jgi:hypothetical protein
MVYVLALSAVDREFESRLTRTKDYDIGICYFSAKHASLRSKRKGWNQDNVSVWSNISTSGLLFQWTSTIQNNLSVLV